MAWHGMHAAALGGRTLSFEQDGGGGALVGWQEMLAGDVA